MKTFGGFTVGFHLSQPQPLSGQVANRFGALVGKLHLMNFKSNRVLIDEAYTLTIGSHVDAIQTQFTWVGGHGAKARQIVLVPCHPHRYLELDGGSEPFPPALLG
jgi:hypothetical protein